MVAKKKKKKGLPPVVTENDRLKLQLFNSYVDRSSMALDNEKVRMENARLGMVIAQRDLNVAEGNLKVLGDELAEKYQFNIVADVVDWTTGEIRRGPGLDEGGEDGES